METLVILHHSEVAVGGPIGRIERKHSLIAFSGLVASALLQVEVSEVEKGRRTFRHRSRRGEEALFGALEVALEGRLRGPTQLCHSLEERALKGGSRDPGLELVTEI